MLIDMVYLKREGLFFQSGSANQSSKTVLEGNLREIEKETLRPEDVDSFLNGEYRTCVTLAPLLLYRVYGYSPSGQGAGGQGRFATTEYAESRIDAKIRLALKPQWKNTLLVEALIRVPTGTVIQVGKVAAVTLPTDTVLDGGADQIMLPYQRPEEWVLGYRTVTVKPQHEYPAYSKEKPCEQFMRKQT